MSSFGEAGPSRWRNDSIPSGLSDKAKGPSATYTTAASRMADALARYDQQHGHDAATLFEVPASHFLARPAGSSTISHPSATRNGSSMGSQPARSSASDISMLTSLRRPLTIDQQSSTASFVTVQETLGQAQASDWTSHDASDEITSLPSGTAERQDAIFAGMPASASHDGLPSFFGGQRPHMPETSTLAAADFDVDVRSGFLPPEEPVRRLQGIEEELWETALDRARALPLRIGGGGASVDESSRQEARRWRREIRQMLVLHPSPQLTSDIRFARRAHLVLSFLAHMYIHSQPEASEQAGDEQVSHGDNEDEQDQLDEARGAFLGRVPASLAVPWVAISRLIDIPPILTYSTTVLWNWHLRDPHAGFTDDNLCMGTTFSNTPSEEHFYLISVLIEKRGVEALTLMRRSLDEAFVGDTLALRRIRKYIDRLAKVIGALQQLLYDIRNGCDPATFYWGIRPWFNGGDSFVDPLTGQKGWIYEGVEEYGGQRMLFMGPSAGQSSLIHAIDVFLGVDHTGPTGNRSENGTFMERMQIYMSGHHRNFLTHLRSISFQSDNKTDDEDPTAEAGSDVDEEDGATTEGKAGPERHPLRALMHLHGDDDVSTPMHDGIDKRQRAVEKLREAYNGALTALKHLRDEHMRIASLYIISQMRRTPPAQYAPLRAALTNTLPSATAHAAVSVVKAKAGKSTDNESDDNIPEGGVKGTGGTDLVSFLRDCRKNTVDALVT